jgi:N-acetyl-anhydromuramyl-L-alanine amidase AmpD
MVGFTVRTDGGAKRYEIAIATSPDLFGPDGKSHRSRSNFYSTRAAGPLPIERGESVYVLPPEVLARFVGQQKLYYGLATVGNGAGRAEVITMPASGSPYINISGLTGRSLQRVRVLPSRQRAASNYGRAGSEMDWAGDLITPGTQPAAPSAGKDGADKNAAASPVHYDDGYGPLPTTPAPVASSKPEQHPQAKSLAQDSGDDHGIEGPIPDEGASSQAPAQSLGVSPEYPGASRFEPANQANYKAITGTRAINRIVIHITDGQPKLSGTVSWFQNPSARVSSHYIVGRDGEVVQMVKHNDVAWHASSANGDSVGIEHVANTRGLTPTPAQYCASAALANWLASQFNLPIDRTHILGHSEADPKTGHKACPNAVWDWDYYMGMVTSASCEQSQTQSQAFSIDLPRAPGPKKRVRGMALADASARMVGNSPINIVSGGEGNITWELDQFPGVKTTSLAAVAPLQSAETIELSNWPYCDHGNGSRAAAWFRVDWRFSGQSLGQVRITPSGTQLGSKPLRVEARIEDGTSRDAGTTALVVRFTYHFSSDGPDVVAVTELKLFSDGSIDQNSNWVSQVAA